MDTLRGLADGDLRDREVRLDRLLDLFDAARFGQDEDARETLWGALGGDASGVGERATREATERLLQETIALEDGARRAADDAVASFCADAIMLLSTDLQPPGSAEDQDWFRKLDAGFVRAEVARMITELGLFRPSDVRSAAQ